MTQADQPIYAELVRTFVGNGMNMTQAIASAMAFLKVRDIEAMGYKLTQANLAEIAHNARLLAEDVVSRHEAAQGSAFLATMGA